MRGWNVGQSWSILMGDGGQGNKQRLGAVNDP
jgi:hypothetical protein